MKILPLGFLAVAALASFAVLATAAPDFSTTVAMQESESLRVTLAALLPQM